MNIKTQTSGLWAFSLYALLVITSSAKAQTQTDSLAVAKANWQTQQIEKGVTLKQYWFRHSIFNMNEYVSVLEIKPGSNLAFSVAAEPKTLKHTSELAKSAQAIAAINGTFFDVKNGVSRAFIRSDGKIINENIYRTPGRERFQAAAAVFKNNHAGIIKYDGTNNWEHNLDGTDVVLSGPLLVSGGEVQKLDTAGSAFKERAPRSVIAIARGKVLFITIDGRNENSQGMTLKELARFMSWLHAKDALNLDGGGSTTLWLYNQPATGIVNHPTDNKAWDHFGERKVANAILLKKVK